MNLLDKEGNNFKTVATDVDGNYWFEGVFPGSYTIVPEEKTTN